MHGPSLRSNAIKQHATVHISASQLAFIAAQNSKPRAQTRKPSPPQSERPRALPAAEPFIAPRCPKFWPISQPPWTASIDTAAGIASTPTIAAAGHTAATRRTGHHPWRDSSGDQRSFTRDRRTTQLFATRERSMPHACTSMPQRRRHVAPLNPGSGHAAGGTQHTQQRRYARIGARPAGAGARRSSSHNRCSSDDIRDGGPAEPLGRNTCKQRMLRSIQQAGPRHRCDVSAALAARCGMPGRHAAAQTRRDHGRK